ncbi:E3 ubiquitin-protein ligase SIAH2 isoform X7 [Dendrobates tinctorius]|uniref:E3 ubiquitin-protein ligase SIAH2 isoform X7 n=1 Tax=Dendrobates tinctorius TaxID=92724 RepID=UPI003CC96DC4
MERAEEAREPGASHLPILTLRREGQSPSVEMKTPQTDADTSLTVQNQESNPDENVNSGTYVALSIFPFLEVDSTQTVIESAMTEQEEDLYSSISEDLSELSNLYDMEFSHDYRAYFENHLKTLPSVGPPTILAYKRESSEDSRLLAMMKILREQSGKELCEFCGKPLQPFHLGYTIDKAISNESYRLPNGFIQ